MKMNERDGWREVDSEEMSEDDVDEGLSWTWWLELNLSEWKKKGQKGANDRIWSCPNKLMKQFYSVIKLNLKGRGRIKDDEAFNLHKVKEGVGV